VSSDVIRISEGKRTSSWSPKEIFSLFFRKGKKPASQAKNVLRNACFIAENAQKIIIFREKMMIFGGKLVIFGQIS
jgi:hypothetical protein